MWMTKIESNSIFFCYQFNTYWTYSYSQGPSKSLTYELRWWSHLMASPGAYAAGWTGASQLPFLFRSLLLRKSSCPDPKLLGIVARCNIRLFFFNSTRSAIMLSFTSFYFSLKTVQSTFAKIKSLNLKMYALPTCHKKSHWDQ